MAGVELIPAEGSEVSRVGLLEIDVAEFHSRVGDENFSKEAIDILEVSSSAKV